MEAEVRPHVGDAVALEIQDMKPLAGTVSRTLEDGFVVTYELDGEEEDELIADVMKISKRPHDRGRVGAKGKRGAARRRPPDSSAQRLRAC